MILVDLDSLYKAEDKEEIHFNKYFAFRNKIFNVLPSKLQDNDNIYTFNKSL